MADNLDTEFEHVAINENTEVKVPFTSVIDQHVDWQSNMTVSPMATNTYHTYWSQSIWSRCKCGSHRIPSPYTTGSRSTEYALYWPPTYRLPPVRV